METLKRLLTAEDLAAITQSTLAHYNDSADRFWEGKAVAQQEGVAAALKAAKALT